MSLAPYYVLWAVIFYTFVLLSGVVAWLVVPEAIIRLARRVWLGDLVAVWLAYAAAYHLFYLQAYRAALGQPYALWALCAFLALHWLLRRVSLPPRGPEALFALAVIVWALVIAGGFRYIDETAADATLLRERPQAVLKIAAAELSSLRRGLLFSRLDADTRTSTARVLASLAGGDTPDPALLSAFRVQGLPTLLAHYERDLARLRTYQVLQIGLLAVMLLLWGFGRMPEGGAP